MDLKHCHLVVVMFKLNYIYNATTIKLLENTVVEFSKGCFLKFQWKYESSRFTKTIGKRK